MSKFSRFLRAMPLLFTGLLAAMSAQAAIFTVGPIASGCTHATIQGGIDAAASNPGADVVRISNATTWGPGGVTIGQQDVTLDGGFATCTDTAVNGNFAQLVGNAINPNGRPAMISITGSGVRRLSGLQIRGNVRGVNSGGGAIEYSGGGELILSDMEVRDNRADFGGAILSFGGLLTLSNGVLIENNIADRFGGGIHLVNDATLYAVGPNLSIGNNEAYDSGGGLALNGSGASAYIASSGFGSRAVLQSNRAGISFDGGNGNGGAIAFLGGNARVVVFSTSANFPTRIADNRAKEKGGAIHLRTGNLLCVMDTHLIGNSANGGAALYADVDEGANSKMVYNVPTRSECTVPANAPARPVRCNRNATGCNVIEGHITQTVDGTPSGDGVVMARKNIELYMRNATFINNTAGFLISAIDAGRVELNTALMARNTVSGPAIRLGFADVNQGFVMRNVTIANNTIASSNPSVMLDSSPASLSFNNNLIFQPGRTPLTATFAVGGIVTHNWQYNATNAPQVLPNPHQLVLSDARFENAAFNDYRLRIGSSAVNAFAAGSAVDAPLGLDLDGRSRPITLSIFAPDDSNDDLGAFERQEADAWLVNGSFSASAQLRYWEPSANGEAIPGVFWDAQDAVGSPNSGSALVNLPASLAPRLTVLRRCFNVPAPGRYTITAKAQRLTGINADNALLSWRFRENDVTCSTASVQGSGEVAFVSGNGFQPLAAPLQLDLASTTSNSTIEIRLDALSGLNLNGLSNVRFDDISIRGARLLSDDIFANGFD